MSKIQWIFHYFEIMKNKKEKLDIDIKLIDKLSDDIGFSCDLLGLIINNKAGEKMIEIKKEARDKVKDAQNNPNGEKSINDEKPLLSEDEELLQWMSSLPEKKEIEKGLKDASKFFLPKADKKKKIKLGIEKVEKP